MDVTREDRKEEQRENDAGNGAGAPRQDRRKRPGRRTEIAEAALAIIAEHGLASATNARIAAAVGVSPPGLYAHFENHQDILIAAMDILIQRIRRWYGQSSNPNVSERLWELGTCHAPFMAADVNGFALPAFEFIVSPRSTGLGYRFGERQRESYEILTSIVEEGQAQGTIRSDIDPRLVAWGLITFAWAEDIARLAGLNEFIEDGMSLQILRILLDHAAAPITLRTSESAPANRDE